MMRKWQIWGWLALAIGSHAETVVGEDDSVEASPALRTAVLTVWHEHPELQAARYQLEAARARADAAAQPLYNPEVGFEREHADDDTVSAGVSLGIDWSGKRKARAAAGDAEYTVAEADFMIQRSTITADWLKAWAAWQVAEVRLALGRERVLLMTRFAELGERQFGVGDITRMERDLAVLAATEARANQGELLSEQAAALRTLRSSSASPVATGQLPRLAEVPPPLAEPITAVERLPELLKAKGEAAAASARITVSERDRRPDPTIALRGGRVDVGPYTEPLFGLAVWIPLPVRNTFRAEVVAARADADEAESNVEAVRLRATARIEEAALVYQALRLIWLDPAALQAKMASERAALLDRLWTAGEISTADYLIQLKQSIDTELAREALRARLWQAWFEYLAAAGSLEQWLGLEAFKNLESP